MKSVLVVYTDDNDLQWIVAVPENLPEEEYASGIVLGPPDLSPLMLSHRERVALQRALVKKRWYEAPQLMGQRAGLQALLRELWLPEALYKQILYLYQIAYYGE